MKEEPCKNCNGQGSIHTDKDFEHSAEGCIWCEQWYVSLHRRRLILSKTCDGAGKIKIADPVAVLTAEEQPKPAAISPATATPIIELTEKKSVTNNKRMSVHSGSPIAETPILPVNEQRQQPEEHQKGSPEHGEKTNELSEDHKPSPDVRYTPDGSATANHSPETRTISSSPALSPANQPPEADKLAELKNHARRTSSGSSGSSKASAPVRKPSLISTLRRVASSNLSLTNLSLISGDSNEEAEQGVEGIEKWLISICKEMRKRDNVDFQGRILPEEILFDDIVRQYDDAPPGIMRGMI